MSEQLLSGNVGEWSEIYVFFRLLASGKMNVADDTLTAIPTEFYKILAILRKESESENEYLRADDRIIIKVKNSVTSNVDEFQMSVEQFKHNADLLFEKLKNQTGRSASYPRIQSFMDEIKICTIKDIGHKRDITISIEDFHNGMAQTLGFSIKSFIGKQSTLFNPGAGTNFIYKVDFPDGLVMDCDKFNAETYNGQPGKIAARLNKIAELGGKISFDHIQSDCLNQNLRTIDGELPVILANALLLKYRLSLSSWFDILNELNNTNPLKYRINDNSPVYEVKIARFLQDAAMGMTPENPWSGFYDADGGQIIVKKDGDIVCYHIYELNRFRQYLLNATRIDQPSTGEDGDNPGHVRLDPKTGKPKKPFLFGWLYKEDGQYFFKINLQVRFKPIPKKALRHRPGAKRLNL